MTDDVVIADGETLPWERDLLTLFVQNQIRVVLALPLFAALFALMTLQWTPWQQSLAWFASALGCQMLQYVLCRLYLKAKPKKSQFTEWLGLLSGSEFLTAACWSTPLFLLWNNASDLQHVYIVASLIAMVAARIMISANFMPIIIAGTGLMTFALALRCLTETGYLYAGLGALAIGCQVFFVLVARKLQETARDMLIFKAQKEELITKLMAERDRSEIARAEALREKLRAEEASKAKSQFLATMSHELRTPLNAIIGFSEMIAQEDVLGLDVARRKEYAQLINDSGQHLLSVVNGILDMSKMESGNFEISPEPFAPRPALLNCCNLVALKAREVGVDLVTRVPDDLPIVNGDPRAFKQIVLNLVSNAIKFTERGGKVTVSASAEGSRLVLRVSDTGVGIAADDLKRIGDPFFQAGKTYQRRHEGTGLGLSIVKGLVGLHHGEMNVESKVDEGTIVSVALPLAFTPPAAIEPTSNVSTLKPALRSGLQEQTHQVKKSA